MIIRILLLLLGISSFNCAADETWGTPVVIPGTGLHVVPPPGLQVALAGPTLIDANGETVISFAMNVSRFSLENNPTWRAIYVHPPRVITISSLAGNLYRRTRSEDGGAWDGWMLVVPRGKQTLTVLVTYTGRDADRFEHIPDYLRTISWDDSVPNPELAVGVRLVPMGLHLVTGVFGPLSYTETGEAGASGPSLVIQAMPLPLSKVDSIFPGNCKQVISKSLGDNQFIEPSTVQRQEFAYCEGWNNGAYVALGRLSTGALIVAVGTSSSSRFPVSLAAFRSAMQNLQVLPGRLHQSGGR